MKASDKAKKDLFGRTQAQQEADARATRRRILDKLQADPDGIWASLLADLEAKDAAK